MLSHKKYQEIVEGFLECGIDNDTLDKLLTVIKNTFNYSEDQHTYKPAYYEKVKEKRKQGDTTWNDYQRRYHQLHRDQINQKRRERYYAKKQQTEVAST